GRRGSRTPMSGGCFLSPSHWSAHLARRLCWRGKIDVGVREDRTQRLDIGAAPGCEQRVLERVLGEDEPHVHAPSASASSNGGPSCRIVVSRSSSSGTTSSGAPGLRTG